MLVHLFRAGRSHSTSHPLPLLLVLPVAPAPAARPRRPRAVSHAAAAQLALVAIRRDSGRSLPLAQSDSLRRTRHFPCTPDTSASTLSSPTIPVGVHGAGHRTLISLHVTSLHHACLSAFVGVAVVSRRCPRRGRPGRRQPRSGVTVMSGPSAAITELGSYRIRETVIDGS